MKELELVQNIGNEICEGCGPHRDCELEYKDCSRITNALKILKTHTDMIDELKDFAIWLTGCGYDFCQHDYFIKQRDKLLKGDDYRHDDWDNLDICGRR